MTASSIRSSIVAAAAAAAIADIVVVIIALVSGAALAAIFAIIAGLIAIGGASYAANRAAAAVDGNAKQLDRANIQVKALTLQLSDVADYLSHAGSAEDGSNPRAALSAAKENIEVVADGSASQLDKAERANTIAAKLSETVEVVDKATKDNLAATENVIHAVVEISRALEETATNAQKVAAG